MNYEEIAKERINYHYADFLKDCQSHHIHDDISRAVWNLSRSLMHDYYEIDYRPFLMDNLEKDFDIDSESIFWEIEDKVLDGLNLQVKDEGTTSYCPEYSDYSILSILNHLNYYYEDEQ